MYKSFNVAFVINALILGGVCVYSYNVNNGADIVFPVENPVANEQEKDIATVKNDLLIPLDFARKINNYTVHDLLLNLVDDYEDDALLANRFGEDVERSPAVTPKSAGCMPELRTVSLKESNDPSVIYIPSCTRLEQCGGCCSHNLLMCEPKETETVSFKVIKTQFHGGNRLKYVGKEVIHVEKHVKCACGCKIKEKDCKRFQVYYPGECRCGCVNQDEQRKCYQHNATKLWNPDKCSCECRDIKECSTGFVFDINSCKCVTRSARRIYPDDNQESNTPILLDTSDFKKK